MSEFKKCIGLEIHAQINTKTKLFSRSLVDDSAEPNTQVDWLDAGMPGALPVPNESAIFLALKTCLALNMRINNISVFDRKHYFYQDSPLGYQITQFYKPIGLAGFIDCSFGRVRINRLHIESDAGKSIYENGITSIDLNRAGVPLMEIVTEPDFENEEQVVEFLKELRLILMAVESSKCDMEKGNFRVDVNISISRKGELLGTRVEIKNLNSFTAIRKAINYEAQFQEKTILAGGKVSQETKLFDSVKNITQTIREKEEAWEYCYFPDPDLLPIVLTQQEVDDAKNSLPKLPQQVRAKLQELGIALEQAYVLTESMNRIKFFNDLINLLPKKYYIKASNWVCTQLIGFLENFDAFLEQNFEFYTLLAKIILLCEEGEITRANAKELMEELAFSKEDIDSIIKQRGYLNKCEIDLDEAIDSVLNEFPKEVEKYKAGKVQVLMHFVGALMKLSKGKLNPEILKQKLEERLNNK